MDNYCIHKAKAVEQWLASHPRFVLLWLPTYCPRANPIERVFGDVHDKCTRNHKRKRLRDVVQDVEQHVQVNGPWRYNLSQLYQAPEITAAVERMTLRHKPRSPHECTNLMWTDLVFFDTPFDGFGAHPLVGLLLKHVHHMLQIFGMILQVLFDLVLFICCEA